MANEKDMCISEQKVQEILKGQMVSVEEDLSMIRKTIFWAASTLIPGLLFVGIWVGTIQSQVTATDGNVDSLKQQHNRFEDKVDGKLERIENLLIQLTDKVK